MYDILQLNEMLVPELKDIADQMRLKNYKKLNKQELIYKILDTQAITDTPKKKEVVEEVATKTKRKTATRKKSTSKVKVEATKQDDTDVAVLDKERGRKQRV